MAKKSDPIRRELCKLERKLDKALKKHRKTSQFKTEEEYYAEMAKRHEEDSRLENLAEFR